jgi:peptide/nickel transport system permease protein
MLLSRLLFGFVVVFGVVTILFLVLRVIPGDPARVMATAGTDTQIKELRRTLGLDKPLVTQYLIFVQKMFKGDFGKSFYSPQESILSLVLKRAATSLKLGTFAILFALVTAIPLGILSALKPGSIFDRVSLGFVMVCQSLPNFWLGMILVLFFALKLHVFPATGARGFISIILPGIAVGLGLLAVLTRFIRLNMIDILEADYIKAARARGVSESQIILRYAFKNVVLYILTIVTVQFGVLIGGIVIVEFVFDFPGLGLLTLNAVLRRDYPLVQAIVTMVAVLFVFLNLLTDVSYYALDPRVRKAQSSQ